VPRRWDWAARGLDLPYFPVTPTFPWLGLLGFVPLPTKWRIVFGRRSIWRAQYGPDAHRDELLVNRLKEEIRERIQRMVVAALSERDSVFREGTSGRARCSAASWSGPASPQAWPASRAKR
jgi:hypothetical protein